MLKIGNIELENRFILAPMAGVTNLPFRLIIRRLGAGLVYSEMVSAMGLYMNQKKTMEYLVSDPAERPLAVQIFGSDPSVMAMAAQVVVKKRCDIVDINMGCPVKKGNKDGSGAAFLKVWTGRKRSYSSQGCMRGSTYCKNQVRLDISDSIIACDAARMIEECGANAVIYHARDSEPGLLRPMQTGTLSHV
jgi:tRNA-dihydrouridine synthase